MDKEEDETTLFGAQVTPQSRMKDIFKRYTCLQKVGQINGENLELRSWIETLERRRRKEGLAIVKLFFFLLI